MVATTWLICGFDLRLRRNFQCFFFKLLVVTQINNFIIYNDKALKQNYPIVRIA